MSELMMSKLPQHIGSQYKIFGTILLNDRTGAHIDAIEVAQHGDPARIVRDILREWLKRHEDATWEILIKTLKDCQLSQLAFDIEEKIQGVDY